MSDDHRNRMTIDPITGHAVTCEALRAIAERCFDDVYRVIDIDGDSDYDPLRVRAALRPCYRRARHVVRACGLTVRVGPRRARR